MSDRTVVIGAGFAGLATASVLARAGLRVTLIEQNTDPGGRARRSQVDGFTFDRGPSWYWMPDVFEGFFAHFGQRPSDHYELIRLDPSYSVYFGKEERWRIPASMDGLRELFEKREPGAGRELDVFLAEAQKKYELGIHDMVWKPGRSFTELIDLRTLKGLLTMRILGSYASHVRRHFKDPRLIALLEFPILFLGATPRDTPALYSLMNHADMGLGTWYPMGGMGKVVDAMVTVARQNGVEFRFGESVQRIEVSGGAARRVATDQHVYDCDNLVGGADYHHVEQCLLEPRHRTYSEAYWQGRVLAPSVLMFYLGVSRKLDNLDHHTLFFDEDLDLHAHEIYKDPRWPTRPLFYVSCTSKTDPSVAPPGHENLVLLIPIAPALKDDEATRKRYYHLVMDRLERLTGQRIRPFVVHHSSCSVSDLEREVNAFKGNAYGLASTLRQTANLRPSIRSSKVRNLYYTGQFTVPGPGVPPALISGQLVAREMLKDMRR